jgi:hypothetical protein
MPSKIIFSNEEKEQIIQEYSIDKLSSKQIGKNHDVSLDTILRLLRYEKVQIRNESDCQKKYSINDNYFNIIDSEDKAYFLGLMFADGYNNENKGEAAITLQSGDTEILNVFREKLMSNKPLRIDRKYYKLAIENNQISMDLAKHGCVQAKTFKLKFPKLRNDLIRHFIRGYFDGDGSITHSYSNNKIVPMFFIISTKEFLDEVQKILMNNLKLSKTKFVTRHPERNHNIRTLIYGSYGNCLPIYKFLYENATIFLKRKKNKFESIFKKLNIDYEL